MYYDKGTFVVVPNINNLEGKDPLIQTIYLWMCKFSNEDGFCYPSVHRLAKCVGCSETSIKNKIKDLEELGLISKKRRYKDSVELTSEYKILLGGVGQEVTQGGQEVSTELNPLIIIKEKSEILDLLGEEDTQKYKNQLICLWYLIELGYKLERDKSSVLADIEWLREKADIYGYRMIDGSYDWNTIKQKFDRRSEWHKGKKTLIDNYKNSVITFLQPKDYQKGKQKK